ncbi:MAG: hypothetical protein NC834_05110 [Candidatus Omnitrophica bacterium]|nr:hypothetical protein [Candidatus Omnitrophota bacterium]
MKNKYYSLVLLVFLGLTWGFLQGPLRWIRRGELENAFRILYTSSNGLRDWLDYVLDEFNKEIEQLEIISEKGKSQDFFLL